ncbi:MAG: putative sulfate exporter family transporter [Actinomycetes bacterium]
MNLVKLLKLPSLRDLFYLTIIAAVVAVTFLINHFYYFLSPLFLSLIAGLLISNFLSWPTAGKEALNFASKKCLRFGVILLGLQITLHKFVEIGFRGFAAILLIVILTFTGVRFFAKKSRMSSSLAMLIAGGFAICGASAVAAIGSAKKSASDEISYAVGLVTLCGTLSIFVIPPITKLFSLSHSTAGAWIGAAVHDVGQVIATASVVGGSTMQYAVISKLARVVLLAPLLIMLTLGERDAGAPKKKLSLTTLLPPFIISFLVVALLNNTVHLPAHTLSFFINVSKFLLSMGLFAMAANVRWSSLRKIGGKPLLFGLSAWVICGGLSLGILRLVGL